MTGFEDNSCQYTEYLGFYHSLRNPAAHQSADSTSLTDTTFSVTPDSLFDKGIKVEPLSFDRQTCHFGSIITLLDPQSVPRLNHLDLPQMSSRFDYDPMLLRSYQGSWGETESIYPLGMSPSSLSRAGDLFGDAAFTLPVPVPGSERWLRVAPSSKYYFLTPALAGLGAPFGRLVCLYQETPSENSDSALSKVHVTRGRGGFANTYVTFANRFGSLGTVSLDASFLKYDGIRFFTESKVERLRLINNLTVANNTNLRIGLFFNRLRNNELFFPPHYEFYGRVSDNYSGIAVQVDRLLDQSRSYGSRLTYRNDDQKLRQSSLDFDQRFQVIDGNLYYHWRRGQHDLQADIDLRYLHYSVYDDRDRVYYLRLALGDLLHLTDRITLYGNLSLLAASGVTARPAGLALIHYQHDSTWSTALLLARGVILPQAEMKYLPAIARTFIASEPDYRIEGNCDLDAGRTNNMEVFFSYAKGRLDLHVRSGISQMFGLPAWQVDDTDYYYSDYHPIAVDRNLIFATTRLHLSLPHNAYLSAAYGYRQVFKDDIDYTYGPEHLANGLVGWRYLIPKLEVTVSASAGVKYRSPTLRYFDGSGDNAKFVAESFLSFDLKRFHFFYNYTNLFDTEYALNGRFQPGRSRWWGFTWEFVN